MKVIRHHLDAGEEVLLVKCLKLVKCGWCGCCFACIFFWILSKVNSNFFALIEWMTRDARRVMRNRCFGILINDDFGGKFGNVKHFKVFDLNVSIAFQVDYLCKILLSSHNSSFAEKLFFPFCLFCSLFVSLHFANIGQIVDIKQPIKSRGEQKVSY